MIIIREALPGDYKKIKIVTKSAFYREGKDELFNEWEFIDHIINDPGFIKELFLVAELNDVIVGYVLLTAAQIGTDRGLSLGPLAVSPKHQKMGIGKELVKAGTKKAKMMEYEWIALIGGDYYLQFGFEPASQYRIILSKKHPENEYLKILFIDSSCCKKVNGSIRFCDSFYNEDGQLL